MTYKESRERNKKIVDYLQKNLILILAKSMKVIMIGYKPFSSMFWRMRGYSNLNSVNFCCILEENK